MKTIAICGSMRFEKQMQSIAFMLETKYGMNALQCVYNTDKKALTESEIETLENAHLRKIELSDAVYVVDIDGYIGEQVSKEIGYAKSLGKEIIFHSEFDMNI